MLDGCPSGRVYKGGVLSGLDLVWKGVDEERRLAKKERDGIYT